VSLERTRQQLAAILENADNRVVALSGLWGTGKTHLWQDIQKDSDVEYIQNALSTSLFGVKDISTVKIKLTEQVLTNFKDDDHIRTAIKLFNKYRGVAGKFFSTASLIDELALVASPNLLRDKFIVLDDIERKSAELPIDEVLGFIDEFSQRHGARFLIIMNLDKLEDSKTWDLLREKVVEHEVKLKTTPDEAYNIAALKQHSPYSDKIMGAIVICGVTNIRIAQKVIRAVDSILRGHDALPDAVIRRMIPSTVLLAATHYKGIGDGPPLSFILNPTRETPYQEKKQLSEEEKAVCKRQAGWNGLMQSLDVMESDEYEELVVEFLQSGLFERKALDEIITRYAQESELIEYQCQVREFHKDITWNVNKNESELLSEASVLLGRIELANGASATSLSRAVETLPNGEELANNIIDSWLQKSVLKLTSNYEDSFFPDSLHPKIQETIQNLIKQREATLTIVDVCREIVKHSGWSSRHENALNAATLLDWRETLRGADPDDLKLVVLKMRDMCLNRKSAYSAFEPAIVSYIKVCSEISKDTSNRLSRLILGVFQNAGISELLDTVLVGEG